MLELDNILKVFTMNKKIIDYKIIFTDWDNDFTPFTEEIQEYIDNGWQPLGGVQPYVFGDGKTVST